MEFLYILFLIIITLFISIFIHEFGHYLGFRIFKIKPKFFIIGTSLPYLKKLNNIINFEYNGTKFHINPIPTGGIVESYISTSNLNKKEFLLATIGGVLFNFLMGIFSAIIYFYYYHTIFTINCIENFFFLLMVLNFICLLNLIPIKGSDGWYCIQLIFKEGLPAVNKKDEIIIASKLSGITINNS